MSTLAEIRDRVEQKLADTGNAIWSTTWIDEGIKEALDEYSLSLPRRVVEDWTINGADLSANGTEYDVSQDTSYPVFGVLSVWTPYVAADPPGTPRQFQYWREQGKIFLIDTPERGLMEDGNNIRLRYATGHTISGLDSATVTTIFAEHETLLINGAAGTVAASRALDLTEQVTIDKLTAQQVRAWGLSKLQEFRAALRTAAQSRNSGHDRISLPKLDRWDRDGAGWA